MGGGGEITFKNYRIELSELKPNVNLNINKLNTSKNRVNRYLQNVLYRRQAVHSRQQKTFCQFSRVIPRFLGYEAPIAMYE